MKQDRRLQVFVSSTYLDLREERQAAVEAILSAGHIPAGMELFSAGDQSQMEVIQEWIEESDAFLLILGGRYGSVDSSSGKSYTHLEYEAAEAMNKPLFACVIDETALRVRVQRLGADAIEQEHPDKLREFRKRVLQKIVRFWADPRDIKLAIHETLSQFARRADLVGWVRADMAVNVAPIAEELGRLVKENGELRQRLTTREPFVEFGGISYSDMVALLRARRIERPRPTRMIPDIENETIYYQDLLGIAKEAFDADEVDFLTVLWAERGSLAHGMSYSRHQLKTFLEELHLRGLLFEDGAGGYRLTDEGKRFVNRLEAEMVRARPTKSDDGA